MTSGLGFVRRHWVAVATIAAASMTVAVCVVALAGLRIKEDLLEQFDTPYVLAVPPIKQSWPRSAGIPGRVASELQKIDRVEAPVTWYRMESGSDSKGNWFILNGASPGYLETLPTQYVHVPPDLLKRWNASPPEAALVSRRTMKKAHWGEGETVTIRAEHCNCLDLLCARKVVNLIPIKIMGILDVEADKVLLHSDYLESFPSAEECLMYSIPSGPTSFSQVTTASREVFARSGLSAVVGSSREIGDIWFLRDVAAPITRITRVSLVLTLLSIISIAVLNLMGRRPGLPQPTLWATARITTMMCLVGGLAAEVIVFAVQRVHGIRLGIWVFERITIKGIEYAQGILISLAIGVIGSMIAFVYQLAVRRRVAIDGTVISRE